ncbi:hypothetical protein D3C84_1041150 [compost metagenome]
MAVVTVTGKTRLIRYQRIARTGQTVEQGRFAHIGAPYQGNSRFHSALLLECDRRQGAVGVENVGNIAEHERACNGSFDLQLAAANDLSINRREQMCIALAIYCQ